MKSKEKILVVTALTGFVRAFLTDDFKILQNMGYEVWCAANADMDDRDIEANKFFFDKLNVKFINIPFSPNRPFAKQNIKAYLEFRKLLKENKFKAVHIHTPIPGIICRLTTAKYRKHCKVIYTTHGFYFHSKSSKKQWMIFYTAEKFMSRFTDAIITINNEDYNNAKNMHCKHVYHINGVGVNTKKYIDAEVDREECRKELGITSEEIALLAVGELSARKNHQIIIKAMSLIKDIPLVYVICGKAIEGEGTYSELKTLADKLGVKIIFAGYRTDVPQLAKSLDIGTIPSVREGLGLAGIEMLAAGMPLAASDVHGIRDYAIDGVTGYTAEPYDEKGFADVIRKLSESAVREAMKERCVETAKAFDMSISHEQRKEIYLKEII